ncbi:MAG TPA: hypothetical protein P5023_07090, partial [Bacteroidales bacterium]|nr:hypothetical protein [Bacteroidales bacterium]
VVTGRPERGGAAAGAQGAICVTSRKTGGEMKESILLNQVDEVLKDYPSKSRENKKLDIFMKSNSL